MRSANRAGVQGDEGDDEEGEFTADSAPPFISFNRFSRWTRSLCTLRGYTFMYRVVCDFSFFLFLGGEEKWTITDVVYKKGRYFDRDIFRCSALVCGRVTVFSKFVSIWSHASRRQHSSHSVAERVYPTYVHGHLRLYCVIQISLFGCVSSARK